MSSLALHLARRLLGPLALFAAADHLIAQTVVYNTDTTISSNTSATVAVVTAGATVTVDGTNFTPNTAYVGGSNTTAGDGAVVITHLGTVASSAIYLGYLAGSSGTVTITGSDPENFTNSSWIINSFFRIGQSGTGTVTVSDGGLLSGGILTLAYNPGSTGTLNIGAAADAPAAAAGFVDTRIRSGAGTATLQLNTTSTRAAPLYFTGDGTSEGGPISTSGGLTLVHTAGTTIFGRSTADLLHTGGNAINGGAAYFNTNVASAVTVASGATLGGSGTFQGNVSLASGATLEAGGGPDTPGVLTFNDGLTLAAGSAVSFQLGSADLDPGIASDQIVVTAGTLDLTGPITLDLYDSGGFSGGSFDLVVANNAVVSNQDGVFVFGHTISGYTYNLNWDDNVLRLEATAIAVPEPTTAVTLAGAAALCFAGWRRRRAAASA